MIKHFLLLIYCFFWVTCTPLLLELQDDIEYFLASDPADIISNPNILYPATKAVVIPPKSLPKGWVINRETLAIWKSSLPEVLGIAPDTMTTAEYWNEILTLPSGIKLPIRRAKVTYHYKTRLTNEVVELHFVNIDNIYSLTNFEPSHYQLDGILKSIELLATGFPQLKADDVLKHKVLMEYGTPNDFDGSWHRYKNKDTKFAVRVIDDKHLAVQLHSRLIERQLKQAIQDVYSEEGIELRKQQLMDGFEL